MVERDAVRRAYDDLAEAYDAQRSESGRGTELLGAFLDSLSDSPRVLDAGCGQGRPVLRRIEAAGSGVGVDISREQLLLAVEHAPGAALAQADLTDLPFEADAFDAVVAYWSLIHVPLGEHQTAIDEFARVLRPGGRALVCEGVDGWCGENDDWLDTGTEMQWEIAGEEATREQLRRAGFAVRDTWRVAESGEEREDPPWILFEVELDT